MHDSDARVPQISHLRPRIVSLPLCLASEGGEVGRKETSSVCRRAAGDGRSRGRKEYGASNPLLGSGRGNDRIPGERTGHCVTEFGRTILGKDGADPFLEDIRTLWLVHWKLSTNGISPLLAWDYLLNRWQDPILAPSLAVDALVKEAALQDQHLSSVTIQQHFDTFLHTYVPTRGRKGEVQEDNLDSPLVELELLVKTGERELDTGERREAVYAFRREEKPDITPELFAYCVVDFWRQRYSREETLPLATIANGHGSPGQIFKLREEDIRTRLATLDARHIRRSHFQ